MKKTLDASFTTTKRVAANLLASKQSKLRTSRTDVEESLLLHLRSIKNWSAEVSFSDLQKAKQTTKVFIQLDLYLYPRRMRIEPNETIEVMPLRQIFNNNTRHVVLLGAPGAGKTTSTKYLCQLLLHDEDFQRDRFSFPILIRFRELNKVKVTEGASLIVDELIRILGLTVQFSEDLQLDIPEKQALKEKLVITFLEDFRVLLILDGFDELSSSVYRTQAITEIANLATQLEQCSMIVTCRTGEFKSKPENTDEYEICSLNQVQVSTFARKWLDDEEAARDFLLKIYRTPFADTAIRPLTLAHLCAIYERIKDIPKSPKPFTKRSLIFCLRSGTSSVLLLVSPDTQTLKWTGNMTSYAN